MVTDRWFLHTLASMQVFFESVCLFTHSFQEQLPRCICLPNHLVIQVNLGVQTQVHQLSKVLVGWVVSLLRCKVQLIQLDYTSSFTSIMEKQVLEQFLIWKVMHGSGSFHDAISLRPAMGLTSLE